MKTFAFKFVYVDRREGPRHEHIRENASSLPVATARATRYFMKTKTRKQRNDIATSGVKIEAVIVGDYKPEVQS